jgi:reverse gyrase
MTRFQQFCTTCSNCGGSTSKAYARQHDGKCKACASGLERSFEYRGPKCPDCGGPISSWKLKQGYHCDECTRATDPIGWANEVRGFND